MEELMSASDHLNPRQFYHGSQAELEPGVDTIDPEEGHAYFTDHYGTAREYASLYKDRGAPAFVYTVKPTGRYSRDTKSARSYRSRSPLEIVQRDEA
jgi:hypothetical protein